MGKLKNLLIETAEDEEFNRIERESKQRKEAVLQALHDENERLGLYKDAYGEKSVAMPDYLHLMEELSVARMLIRELGDRLAKLEKPWVGLTRDEQSFVYQTKARAVLHFAMHGALEHNSTSRIDSFWVDFANAIEAKLKEKNNG
jgi:hypothetical protein